MKKIRTNCGAEIVVDDDDFSFLGRYSWNLNSHGYATTVFRYAGKGCTVAMHRLIMGMSECHVDHANGEKLDNRKANLRLCTRSQNMANSKRLGKSGYRGVYLCNDNRKNKTLDNRYAARITVKRKRIWIGIYSDIKEAAKAYDVEAKKYFGIFARLNFPEKPPEIPIDKRTEYEKGFDEGYKRGLEQAKIGVK